MRSRLRGAGWRGYTSRVMAWMRVDFPLPFGPRMAVCSPHSIENVTSRRAQVPSLCTVTFVNSINLGMNPSL